MDLILTDSIREGLRLYRDMPNAVLMDVRAADEYAEGHLPGSVNLPLNALETDIYDVVPETDTPIFLYCLSGSRSAQAAAVLRELGYEHAASIGGISGYKGDLEK